GAARGRPGGRARRARRGAAGPAQHHGAHDDPAFVALGSQVGPDDSVCILEVMKLFNTVKAGVAGEIVEILVQEGDMVEEGDVLFRVKPQ
ncbi:acetyl-CoA carboxylase biotin carboxyl carrier protein, partial [Bordetella pertussis]|uniref:acetyl-CoA carboxylase biotin carboxyl carrier protein n=1 Tax=Bordetella pertussis TaxID=520 RepID=UPI000ABD6BDC